MQRGDNPIIYIVERTEKDMEKLKPVPSSFIPKDEIGDRVVCDADSLPYSSLELIKPCKEVLFRVSELVYCPLEKANNCIYRDKT